MKKILLAAVLVMMTTLSAMAQPHPQDEGYNFIQNVSYVSADETDAYRKERCVLDIYYPDTDKGFATLIWFHGGGLNSGNKEILDGFRRQGFAYEASQALMHYAFHTLGAEEIFAMCCIENSASYRLMERLSMKRPPHHTQYMYFGLRRFGRRIYEDVFEYNITAAEYLLRSCRM